MAKNVSVQVIKPFVSGGIIQKAGTVVEVPERLAVELLNRKAAKVADAAGKERDYSAIPAAELKRASKDLGLPASATRDEIIAALKAANETA